jgi:hypothetical protein
MKKPASPHSAPMPEEIAACAYQLYEHGGLADGRALEHWLAAEAQLIAERARPGRSASKSKAKSAAGAAPVARRTASR